MGPEALRTMELDDNEFDNGRYADEPDFGEKDKTCEFELFESVLLLAAGRAGGGYFSYGDEKDMRFSWVSSMSMSMSESLSSGTGMLVARSRDSSSACPVISGMIVEARIWA